MDDLIQRPLGPSSEPTHFLISLLRISNLNNLKLTYIQVNCWPAPSVQGAHHKRLVQNNSGAEIILDWLQTFPNAYECKSDQCNHDNDYNSKSNGSLHNFKVSLTYDQWERTVYYSEISDSTHHNSIECNLDQIEN